VSLKTADAAASSCGCVPLGAPVDI
jgi:hypothetical protein